MSTYNEHGGGKLSTVENPIWQVGDQVTISQGGLVEGTCSLRCDGDLAPEIVLKYIGEDYVGTSATSWEMKLYAAKVHYNRANIATVTFDAIGILNGDTTDPIVTFPNSVNSEPIETHKRFLTHLAGAPRSDGVESAGTMEGYTSETRKFNGGIFAVDLNKKPLNFMGFLGDNAPAELRGVRSYYRGSIMCRKTYYQITDEAPTFQEPCRIVDAPSDVDIPTVPGISKWLHLVTSCEQIGKANIWRVTEEYIAGTNDVISQLIYGDGV